jgi:hypothetical protein
MASHPLPCVEANVSTLMNVADEELWRKEGLFDLADSVGKDYTSSHKSPSLPSLPSHFRSSPCTPCAPSF